MKRLFLWICLSLPILGCESKKDAVDQKPSLPRDQMEDVLIDLHLSNAYYTFWHNEKEDLLSFNKEALERTLELHQVDAEDFEQSLEYYQTRPEKMDSLYLGIIEKMMVYESQLNEKSPKTNEHSMPAE
jgi:hypothetical protein